MLDVETAKLKALEIIDLYIKRGSSLEVNIPALMKQDVLGKVGVKDGSDPTYDDNFDEDDGFLRLIVDGDSIYSDDESLNPGVKDGMGGKEEVDGSEAIQWDLTLSNLKVLFDEAFFEIQSLIDRNFMVQFQHEQHMRQWFDASEKSYWPYQGFIGIDQMKKYLAWVDEEFVFFKRFVNAKKKVCGGLREPLGKYFKYIEGFKNEIMQDEVQARLPNVGWISMRIKSVPSLQLKAMDGQIHRLNNLKTELDDFKTIYTLQRQDLAVLDGPQLKKMKDIYVRLRALHKEVIRIKRGVLARKTNKANLQEKNTIARLNKRKVTVYFELQAAENPSRGQMMDAFNRLESLEFTRAEKLMQIMRSMRYSDLKFIGSIKQLSMNILQDIDKPFDYFMEASSFVHRKIIQTDFDLVDPIEGSVDLGYSDFRVLNTYLTEFENIVVSFVKSIPRTLMKVFKKYTDGMVEKNDGMLMIAERIRKAAAKVFGSTLPGFETVFLEQMTDCGISETLATNSDTIGQSEAEIISLTEYSVNKIVSEREPLDFFGEKTEEFDVKHAAYLRACEEKDREIMQLRDLRKEHKSIRTELQHVSEDARVASMLNTIQEVEAEMKKIEPQVQQEIVMRKKLLRMKTKICEDIISKRVERSRKCLRMILKKQVEYIDVIVKMWGEMLPQVDLLKDMKWIGDNFILHDADGIFKGMSQAVAGNIAIAKPKGRRRKKKGR